MFIGDVISAIDNDVIVFREDDVINCLICPNVILRLSLTTAEGTFLLFQSRRFCERQTSFILAIDYFLSFAQSKTDCIASVLIPTRKCYFTMQTYCHCLHKKQSTKEEIFACITVTANNTVLITISQHCLCQQQYHYHYQYLYQRNVLRWSQRNILPCQRMFTAQLFPTK